MKDKLKKFKHLPDKVIQAKVVNSYELLDNGMRQFLLGWLKQQLPDPFILKSMFSAKVDTLIYAIDEDMAVLIELDVILEFYTRFVKELYTLRSVLGTEPIAEDVFGKETVDTPIETSEFAEQSIINN